MDNLTPYDKYASGDYLLHNIRIFLHAGAKVAIFPETTKFFPYFFEHRVTESQSFNLCVQQLYPLLSIVHLQHTFRHTFAHGIHHKPQLTEAHE